MAKVIINKFVSFFKFDDSPEKLKKFKQKMKKLENRKNQKKNISPQ